MDKKEIQSLIKLINESNISEFKLEDGDLKLTIRTGEYHKSKAVPTQNTIVGVPPVQVATSQPAVQSQDTPPPAPVPSVAASKKTAQTEENDGGAGDTNYLEIKSPIVGTFYRAPGPDKDPYVKVGDTVSKDSVVCIVEAMKLFNEIEAEVSGKIIDVLVEDATPIEYDQVLFLVDPKG